MRTTTILTGLAVDDPLVQSANFRQDAADRAYIDSQIRGVETHLVDSLLSGAFCTWVTLSSGSASVQPGDFGVPAPLSTNHNIVTKLTTGSISTGVICCMFLQAAAAGASVRVAMIGRVPASVTGLSSAGIVAANPSTGRSAIVTDTSGQYIVGVSDSDGSLNLNLPTRSSAPATSRRTDMSAEYIWYKCDESAAPVTNQGAGPAMDLALDGADYRFATPDILGDCYQAGGGSPLPGGTTGGAAGLYGSVLTAFPSTTACSIWAVIRFPINTGSLVRIWGINKHSDSSEIFGFYLNSLVPMLYYKLDSVALAWLAAFAGNGNCSAGVLHLLVGTYDGTTVKFYVDGILNKSVTAPGILDFSAADLHWNIGKAHGVVSQIGMDGNTLDCGCANRVMTAAEIKTMYETLIGV